MSLQKGFTLSSQELVKCNTTELCIKSDMPTLGAVSRQYDQETAQLIIREFIKNLQESLNLRRGMNQAQEMECAKMIFHDFKRLNIADVHQVFTKAKKGQYGELYESLNMAKIYTWFQVYYEERMKTAVRMNQENDHNTIQTGGVNQVLSDLFDAFKERGEELPKVSKGLEGFSIAELRNKMKDEEI